MQRLAEAEQALTLAKTCDIDLPLTLRISRIEGNYNSNSHVQPSLRSEKNYSSPLPDLYIAVQLWAENRPLTLPFYTPHKNFSNSFTWATPITLPIKYRDLPSSAQLTFTVLDVNLPRGPNRTVSTQSSQAQASNIPNPPVTDNFLLLNSTVVGGSTLALFGKKRTLRKGKQRCFIHRGQIADGHVSSTTPSKITVASDIDPNSLETCEETDKLGRLEKLVKKHERGDLPRLEWLDQLTFRQIEKIHAVRLLHSIAIFSFTIVSWVFEERFTKPIEGLIIQKYHQCSLRSKKQPKAKTSIYTWICPDLIFRSCSTRSSCHPQASHQFTLPSLSQPLDLLLRSILLIIWLVSSQSSTRIWSMITRLRVNIPDSTEAIETAPWIAS